MTSSMGHITPEPCGYMNYPSHSLGHHGCVEDYNVEISNSLGINSPKQYEQTKFFYDRNNNSVQIYYSLSNPSNISLDVHNIIGQRIFNEAVKVQSTGDYIYNLEINNLEITKGIYIINLLINGKKNCYKIAV
ncbi:hypothetical protein ACFLQ5_03980 [Bacteroidota bacterium]